MTMQEKIIAEFCRLARAAGLDPVLNANHTNTGHLYIQRAHETVLDISYNFQPDFASIYYIGQLADAYMNSGDWKPGPGARFDRPRRALAAHLVKYAAPGEMQRQLDMLATMLPQPAGPAASEEADLTADAMRVLFGQVIAAVPASQRGQAEDRLTDLLDLATDNLSQEARAEVARQALAHGQDGVAAKRDCEVSLGARIVTAGSPRKAAVLAREQWRQEADDPHYEPDPNDVYEVRQAHSRGWWQKVYPDKKPAAPAAQSPGAHA